MDGTLPDADVRLDQAVALFNTGEHYACHDVLEALWRDERAPVRDLYKGLLQIAVALHHWARGNRRGALRLLDSGAALCARFAPAAQGIDLAALLGEVRVCRSALQGDAPPPDPSCAPRIRPAS